MNYIEVLTAVFIFIVRTRQPVLTDTDLLKLKGSSLHETMLIFTIALVGTLCFCTACGNLLDRANLQQKHLTCSVCSSQNLSMLV